LAVGPALRRSNISDNDFRRSEGKRQFAGFAFSQAHPIRRAHDLIMINA